jgi:hypothetical protein
MPKLFYMQFVVSDWRRDVLGCTPSAVGCWIHLCCAMWDDNQRGVLTGTLRDLAGRCGFQVDDFAAGLLEIQKKGVGNVTPDLSMIDDRKDLVRVECRRMKREYDRKSLKGQWDENNRQITDKKPTEKEWESAQKPTDTCARARDNYSGSGSDSEGESAERGFDFESVYALYPRKEGRKKGLQRCRSQITTRLKYDALARAVKNYSAKVKAEHTEPQYVKQFDTFMGCWEDFVDYQPQLPVNGTHPPLYAKVRR